MTSVVSRTRRTPARRRLSRLRFDHRLVLNRFMLQLFGVDSLEVLALDLKDPNYELLDEDNVSHFHRVLAARFPNLAALPIGGPSRDELRRYDDNIVRHTLSISGARGSQIRWKYFQYLALLFTEIYLDRYFSDAKALLDQLNAYIVELNAGPLEQGPIDPYTEADLRKLAFWMATGSGKTLLMHVNILQFRHYLKLHGREGELNRIILITPNEGLSKQHLEEFTNSGLPAELFDKAGASLFAGRSIEILDIHKLAEESGEKTVAVEAFERNNLVLVDEGHRGAGGEDWKDKRDRLSAEGFSFEYSATFGQAIKAANKEELAQEYARAILFDYSYRYFYADGYGKDYQILNLADDERETEQLYLRETELLYLTASLLSFYQQLRVYEEQRDRFAPYGIERPLWVFVGGTVAKTLSTAEGTDISRIISFLARFVHERDETILRLDRLLSGDTGLVAGGRDLFAHKFTYLIQAAETGERLFQDILERLFNAPTNAHLLVEELKGTDGELALRLGDAEPFGVVNVGDAPKLAKLLKADPLIDVQPRDVAESVFSRLGQQNSRVDLLIGSKKFTEGWNSFRVASLGLMKVGRSEGAQIIQLFGRGVRLRGFGSSLKRSSAVPGVSHPDMLRHLETLSIYGLRADYMAQFKQFLEEEGLPSNDAVEEVILPVVRLLPERPLKTIRVPQGREFKQYGPRVALGLPPSEFLRRPIALDCRPKLQVMVSNELVAVAPTAVEEAACFQDTHLSLFDFDALYFELVRYKEERGWSNLALSHTIVEQVLRDDRWYRLTIPTGALSFGGPLPLRRIRLWQEIALNLLKKYVDRYYKWERERYEAPLREYAPVTEDDPNFIDHYQVVVREAQQGFLPILTQIKAQLETGVFKEAQFNHLHVLGFDHHLYAPLVHLGSKDLEIKPVPLNEGERDFVRDLKEFLDCDPAYLQDKELYLLRNMSRGKGIGFFEAGNFYPDFILWLLVGEHQYVTFIDPKGIVHLEGGDDPKIQFFQKIKDIERAMGDPAVTLNSFIVANTRYGEVEHWGMAKDDFEQRHVLFQRDDPDTYVKSMLERILVSNSERVLA